MCSRKRNLMKFLQEKPNQSSSRPSPALGLAYWFDVCKTVFHRGELDELLVNLAWRPKSDAFSQEELNVFSQEKSNLFSQEKSNLSSQETLTVFSQEK